MNIERTCKRCSDKFIAHSSRQMYCRKPLTCNCVVCGKKFETTCSATIPATCSDVRCKKRAGSVSCKTKKCRICRKVFVPKSSRQLDCHEEIKKICPICGEQYISECSQNIAKSACSEQCFQVYLKKQQLDGLAKLTRSCQICGQEFTPTHGSQTICNLPHFLTCKVCGDKFLFGPQTSIRTTCSQTCADVLRFKNGNPFHNPESREKARQTYFNKTGYTHPMRNPEVLKKVQSKYQERTGYDHPLHNPDVRAKLFQEGSSCERKLKTILDKFNINYIHHKMIVSSEGSHEYDFYLPEYRLFIDVDGVYFHSYLEDPNGRLVGDYYDETRFAILPEDCRLHIIVEGNEERDIKILMDTLFENGPEYYDSEIFKWCREVGFPYPVYPRERLEKDYKHLSERHDTKYVPQARLGDSIIRHYHRSLWDAHVEGYVSPKEAWEDDKLLRKVIANRLIYINDVDPSKVLRGFNVSKIAPRVSVFNPVLARYLTKKYLSEFATILDPFSGWSGRLLGVTSCSKKYIGWDLNEAAVLESSQIIRDLDLDATVLVNDTISANIVNYTAGLLTCPPYGNKEHYNNESIFLDSSSWIYLVLHQIQVSRYVFVVDDPGEYSKYVVEKISTTSHMSAHTEFVLVIDRNRISEEDTGE